MTVFRKSVLCVLAFLAGPASGQTDSRMAQIAAQQAQKATQLVPYEANKVERGLNWFKEHDPLEVLASGIGGFRPRIGSLGAGSGFAVGLEFYRVGLGVSFRTGARTTFFGDRKLDLEFAAPRISGGRYFAQFYAVHHDYSRLSYYGPGADSEKTGHTDFRLEDTATDLTLGMRPTKHLELGATAGYVINNVGRGTDERFASTDAVYSPAQAPGIDAQASFLRTGAYAQFDSRDNPDGPRHGGNYFAQFADYRDRTFGVSHFQRLDLEAQRYFAILNDRKVFALRAKSTLTYRTAGREVPFYMQPSLGGADDLRGYRPYRFRDNNLIVVNGEYRWEVFSGLDASIFGDAGRVFSHKWQAPLSNLESDLGFGLRFNARNKTFLRLDVGFSHEGFQVWVKFSNVFKKGPVHTSSSLGDL
jgi:outer membrane protein assembly factor BamA